jgi:hypothetical protein
MLTIRFDDALLALCLSIGKTLTCVNNFLTDPIIFDLEMACRIQSVPDGMQYF